MYKEFKAHMNDRRGATHYTQGKITRRLLYYYKKIDGAWFFWGYGSHVWIYATSMNLFPKNRERLIRIKQETMAEKFLKAF